MFKSYAFAIVLMVLLAFVGIAAARYGADATDDAGTSQENEATVQRMTDRAPQRIDKPALKEVAAKESGGPLGGKTLRR
ncbi:MAG: hypothetical protein ACTHKB_05575 [Burkholderiaceae bacterium]